MSALEQSMLALCEQHGFTAISVNLNLKQREQSRFDVTVHWDGYSTRGIGCTSVCRESIAEALVATIERAVEERTPPVRAVLADEPLTELAA